MNGELYTQAMADKFKRNKRSPSSGNSTQSYWTVRCKKWIGRMCADCSGLIVWLLRALKLIVPNKDYGSTALIGLLATLGGVLWWVHNIISRFELLERKSQHRKEDAEILLEGIQACLEGLQQLGAT